MLGGLQYYMAIGCCERPRSVKMNCVYVNTSAFLVTCRNMIDEIFKIYLIMNGTEWYFNSNSIVINIFFVFAYVVPFAINF